MSLSGNILALRLELNADYKKIESYFRVLTNQIYNTQKNIDFIRTYLDIESESQQDDDNLGESNE